MMKSVSSYHDHGAGPRMGEAKGVSVKLVLDRKSVDDGLRFCRALVLRPGLLSKLDRNVLVDKLPEGGFGFGFGELFTKLFRFKSDFRSTVRAGEVIVSLQPAECLRDVLAACGAREIDQLIVEQGCHLDAPFSSGQVVAEAEGGSRSPHVNTEWLRGQEGNNV